MALGGPNLQHVAVEIVSACHNLYTQRRSAERHSRGLAATHCRAAWRSRHLLSAFHVGTRHGFRSKIQSRQKGDTAHLQRDIFNTSCTLHHSELSIYRYVLEQLRRLGNWPINPQFFDSFGRTQANHLSQRVGAKTSAGVPPACVSSA